MSIEEKVICLHHLGPRQRTWRFLLPPNHGDCYVCTPDPINNPNCSGYKPLKVAYFSVQPNTRDGEAKHGYTTRTKAEVPEV